MLVRQRVEHEQPLTTARNESRRKQLLQMFAEIALRHPGGLHQLGHGSLAILHLVKDREARRLGEGPEAARHVGEQLRGDVATWGRALGAHAFLICVGRTFTTTRKSVPITSAGTIAGNPSVLWTVIFPKSISAMIG